MKMRKYPTEKQREERKALILKTLGNDRMTAAEMAVKLDLCERMIIRNMALMLDQKLLKVAATAPGKSGHTINVYAARTSASVAPSWIPKQEWFSALSSLAAA
jgi:predicted ArsR family transcriptional regulator